MRDVATIPAQPPGGLAFRRRVSLFGSVRELIQSREMVATLTERELRIRYKQAILGLAWALLQPLTLVLTFTFFIGKTVKIDTHGVPFALFAVVGLIPWTFFSSAVGQGGMSLLANLQLVNKIYCPREVFPLALVGVALVDTITSMIAVVVLFAAKSTMPDVGAFAWGPLLIAIEMMFTIGVTLVASSLIVHVRDIRHVLPVVLQMGIIATPVMWGFEKLDRGVQLWYGILNPLGPIIDAWRRVALFHSGPEWRTLWPATVAAFVWMLVGFRIFKRLEASFADLL